MKYKNYLFFIVLLLSTSNIVFAQDHSSLKEGIVIIEQSYKRPPSFSDENTIVLNGVSEGEYIEFKVKGFIKDFKLVKLKLTNSGDIVEKEALYNIEQLSNQTVLINTVIPEGVPVEKIKWKSLLGKTYEHIIAEDGREGNKSIEFVLD